MRSAPWARGRRDAAVATPATVARTDELRLAEVRVTPGGAEIDVEVRASPRFPAGVPAWRSAEVRVGIHWMGPGGVPVVFDGPRSDRVPLEWLPVTPFRRIVGLGAPPDGAVEMVVELVAEGISWGDAAGLAPMRFPAPGPEHLRPAPMEPRERGPGPPAEPPSETRRWLSSGWPRDASPREMADYVGADLARFLMSVQLMPDEPGRILEIGSNPYFMSRLVRRRYPDAELRMTNFFGTPGSAADQDVVDAEGRVLESFHSDLVDTEATPLPHPDGAFDTVLLCEVIEHLIADPVFQLSEIARVLRPGGALILTTPNVARAANRTRLAQRQGIYDPYSGYGPHGRHNREYTADELLELTAGCGFVPVAYLTRPVHTVPDPGAEWFRAADDDGAGDYHFLRLSRAERRIADPPRPAWLYR